jgi:hypothetical protein
MSNVTKYHLGFEKKEVNCKKNLENKSLENVGIMIHLTRV